jgi:hypothetical protein
MQNADLITDDRPLLEFSPATLLPPLRLEVDETFLNYLKYRIGNYPQVRGMMPSEKRRWKKDFRTRTAQRLSVFSRRYHGPGESAFKKRNYSEGLDEVATYLDNKKDQPIRLKGIQWE